MAHFAKLNSDNIITEVVVINDSDCLDESGNESEAVGVTFCQNLFGADTIWKQTSYNGTIRKNYGSVGYTYDVGKDAFIEPKPYASWVLNESTCQYEPPTAKPVNSETIVLYTWDEDTTSWVEGETIEAP